MPTGDTAEIADGKKVTFQQFAMNCARAFGALVTLRDDMTAEIPKAFKPDSHYSKKVAESEKRLAKALRMTDEQKEAGATKDYIEAIKAYDETIKKNAEKRERYEAMLSQVKVWEAPSKDHVGLKDFMAEQLASSIKFDCDWIPDKPKKLSGVSWWAKEVDAARHDISYYAGEQKKENERAAERTVWVQKLRDSLAASALAAQGGGK